MTPNNDDHHRGAVPTQKQEWVTPKISLMEAENTASKVNFYRNEVKTFSNLKSNGPIFGTS